ncbi:MAG: nitroreductase family protein [archaeon]
MDIKDAIRTRRSIRSYSDKAVSLEDVADILEIARFTPSSGNQQNWKVIVVTDEKLRVELAKVSKKQDWMGFAPVHLVVCNEYAGISKMFKELGKMFSIQNCAALATNIINLAHAQGFGTCWVGSFPADTVKRVLSLPDEGIDPEVIITLGYPAKEELKEQERKEIFDFSYFDSWGKTDASFRSVSFFGGLKEKLFKKKEVSE